MVDDGYTTFHVRRGVHDERSHKDRQSVTGPPENALSAILLCSADGDSWTLLFSKFHLSWRASPTARSDKSGLPDSNVITISCIETSPLQSLVLVPYRSIAVNKLNHLGRYPPQAQIIAQNVTATAIGSDHDLILFPEPYRAYIK